MGLQEAIEELKKQRDEALDKENEALNEPEEELEEVPAEPEEAEEQPEEPVKEEPKEEVKAEKKEDLDDSGYRRLRRDKEAAEKRAQEAEDKARQIEERLAKLERGEIDEMAPQSQTIDPMLEEIVYNHKLSKAEQEVLMLEAEFRQEAPDYDNVSTEYAHAMFNNMRLQNPRLSDIQIGEMTKKFIMEKMVGYASTGHNPIREIYEDAKSLGFTGATLRQAQEEPEQAKEVRSDLSKIAANKARNSGMAGARGRGGASNMTLQAAAELSPNEWKALPAEERRRLLTGG